MVANRGEIATRIFRAASQLDLKTVAVYAEKDNASLHRVQADEAFLLGAGSRSAIDAYLDAEEIVQIALENDVDTIHPGYGFLSENAKFVKLCEEANITFVGPSSEVIRRFGDKTEARLLAKRVGVPVVPGSERAVDTLEEAVAFCEEVGFPVLLKALWGGGGRGMRIVRRADELTRSFESASSEALTAFGNGSLFIERYVQSPRHIEVQILSDGTDTVHLFERDCSVQRRHQKVIETAPAWNLPMELRERLHADSLKLANAAGYRNAGTVEFLVDGQGRHYFIEVNPRIQVEHTVTEEATGIDLVKTQLLLASGATLGALGLDQSRLRVQAAAMQARIQMTSAGRVTAYSEPGGPGVRVDSSLYAGCRPPTDFDPMLLKVISRADVSDDGGADAWSAACDDARRRLLRACRELHIGGSLSTNASEVCQILEEPSFKSGEWTADILDQRPAAAPDTPHEGATGCSGGALPLLERSFGALTADGGDGGECGDPIARMADEPLPPDGCVYVRSQVAGQVVSAADSASAGCEVESGGVVVVVNSMKMEFVVQSPTQGTLMRLLVEPGTQVERGQPVALLRHAEGSAAQAGGAPSAHGAGRVAGEAGTADEDADGRLRADLAKMLEYRSLTTDKARMDVDEKFAARVAARHKRGQLTARESIDALIDPGSTFLEYGRFAVAAQQKRMSLDDLRRRTPADGMLAGIGSVNGNVLDAPEKGRAVLCAYDSTVLAGTQGVFNHMKLDRMLALSEAQRLPLILLAEGGGGRPGDIDVDLLFNSGLGVSTFRQMAKLSGRVPLVGVATGFTFAGNAALLGCCDVVIATGSANIGMGGPAMIAGGGLGAIDAREIGPTSEHARNGVVDLVARDDAHALQMAKQFLSYFQGPLKAPEGGGFRQADQRRLRSLVPENRKRSYDMRKVVETLADDGTWLELRSGYAQGMISGLMRIDGKPLGVLANSPTHLAGAVDSDGALKAARFMELLDAFDLPLLNLVDSPGFMVGPPSERQAAVRKMARMFNVGASLDVPFFSIVLRKAYGLGAMAMAGGSSVGPNVFHVSWPSAEAGPMNLEGAVSLGFAKELAKAEEGPARDALFQKLVDVSYERGGALSVARTLETDDVIDPAESREWISAALEVAAAKAGGAGGSAWRERRNKKRPCVSPW